jgi:hypothetical protein
MKTSDQPPAGADPAAAQQRPYFEAKEDSTTLGQTLDYDRVNKKEIETSGYLCLAPGPYELGVGLRPL